MNSIFWYREYNTGDFNCYLHQNVLQMAGGDKRQQLVSQITHATNIVYNQLGRLNMLDKRFASMEKQFLEQITLNIKTGNNIKARILATELSNVRRLRRTTQHTGLALEAIVIRFTTINEFAAILDTIDPTIEMIRSIQTELSRAIPAAHEAIAEVSTVTSDVLLSANIQAESRISTPMDSDALSILNEIEGVLEDEAKAKLPEIPVGISVPTTEKRQSLQATSSAEGMLVEG